MTNGKILVGIILTIAGFLFLLIPVVGWIYSPILIAVGIAIIILHNTDAKIEQRKDKPLNKSKTKK